MGKLATVTGLTGTGLMLVGALLPDVAATWPEWLRIGLFVLGILLLLAAFVLSARSRNKGESDGGPARAVTQSSSGAGHNVSGPFHGPVTFYPPPPATQDRKSPYGSASRYDMVKVTAALEQALRPHRRPGEAQSSRMSTADPRPDLPLAGVLIRVYKKLGPVPTDAERRTAFLQKVDHEIADCVKFNHMHVWGRSGEGRALEDIPLHIWESGAFDHAQKRFSWPPAYSSMCYLTDLHFNKTEVDRVWPMPPETPSDGKF